jgi:flagellar motor switch protein FliM
VLAISFELRLPETQALLNLVFPSAVSVLMQRALHKSGRRTSSAAAMEHIRRRLMESDFQLELTLPAARVPARELLELDPGKVLALPHKVQDAVALTVAGSRMFAATPVASGSKRAGYIQSVTSILEQEKRQHGAE